jgi:hypothetical protein
MDRRTQPAMGTSAGARIRLALMPQLPRTVLISESRPGMRRGWAPRERWSKVCACAQRARVGRLADGVAAVRPMPGAVPRWARWRSLPVGWRAHNSYGPRVQLAKTESGMAGAKPMALLSQVPWAVWRKWSLALSRRRTPRTRAHGALLAVHRVARRSCIAVASDVASPIMPLG